MKLLFRSQIEGITKLCQSRHFRRPTHRFALCSALLTCVTAAFSTGCSKATPVAETDASAATETSATPRALSNDPFGTTAAGLPDSEPGASNASAATDVVSAFLDSVRRGGDKDQSEQWLTQRSRQILASLGQRMQPMGSPAARYEVTRAVPVEDHPGAALVESFWTEPADPNVPGSTATRSQVGWAMQWEQNGWRISGVAVQEENSEDIVFLDFEDADMMSQWLQPPASPAAEVATQPQPPTR